MIPRLFKLLAAIAVGCTSIVVAPSAISAQSPVGEAAMLDAEQARSGTRWRSIRSPHFEVLFAAGLERDAQRVANTLERVRLPLGRTMGMAPKRTTVVLHNQSVLSNAYVAFGPRREVWVTTPPFFSLLGTGDWLTLLGIHETRHVAQADRSNVGFTRLGHLVMGDFGLIALSHLAVPDWMWEGDAVGIETAFTASGRGRQPEFEMEIRSLALDARLPGYYQAMLGSYEDFFPNEYPLGYLLTTSLRRRHGPDVVGRLFRNASAHSWNPLSFHFAMRRVAGMTPSRLYDSTMREMTTLWRAQLAAAEVTEAVRLTPRPRVYTHYANPQYLSDGSIIAVRSGLADLRQVGRIIESSFVPIADAPTKGDVRAGGMTVAWTELVPDIRWGWSDAAQIKLLDVADGSVRSLGLPGRFAFPIPSPDGESVAAVELLPQGGSAIVVFDASTGARSLEIVVPAAEHAMHVAWRGDGRALVLTRQGTRGKALSVIDLDTRTWRDVIPHGAEDVRRPTFAGSHILYISSWSGIDNVYAVDIAGGERFQVTSTRVGAYDPAVSPDARRLLFADYTSDGFAVAESDLHPVRWRPLSSVAARPIKYYEPLIAQEQFTLDPASVADSSITYPTRRAGLTRYFNVHSWSPAGDLFAEQYGATILSTDVLNTFSTALTYVYHKRERGNEVSLTSSYAGLFPIIDAGVRFGTRSTEYETPGSSSAVRTSWNEKGVEAGLRVPINLSRGYWYRNLELAARGSYAEVSDLDVAAARLPGNGSFKPATVEIEFANVRVPAPRDFAPRIGHTLRLQHRTTPIGGDFHPRKLSASSRVFLPGLAKHHSLQLSGAFEGHRLDRGFGFSSSLADARGHEFLFGRRMLRGSVDYVAPVAYPHLALGPVLYIPRLTMGAFADYFRASTETRWRQLSSAGVELKGELVPFTWSALRFTGGVRLAHRFSDRQWVLEPAFSAPFF